MTDDELPDEDGDDDWPLTPRTVLILVAALDQLISALDTDQAAMLDGSFKADESLAVSEFPRNTWVQSREWWVEVLKSAERVRAGLHDDGWHRPRTVAEEAVTHVAATAGWVDVALDSDPDLSSRIAVLPDAGDMDFNWEEVLPALTGDADVEILWMASLDGIEDPEGEVNRFLRIGDYRPAAWHRLFDREVADTEPPDPTT